MLRKGSIILLLLVLTPMLAWAQNTGKLTGTVTDAETGEPLPGANVVIQGTQRGAATNANGQYTILGVPVGSYDVQASFVGYTPVTVNDVEINSGYTRQLDFALQPGTQLEEVVVEYERPLIQDDAIGSARVVSGEELENLPVRGVTDVAALQAGVVSTEGSDDLNVRGGRDEEVSYYVNGVKVLGGAGSLGVPQQAIQEQEMLIGTIPARYGDAMSGVISITTKSGGSEFFGSLEGITSEVMDPYGYNLGAFSLGGPLWGEQASFFVSGNIESEADASPYRQDLPYLPDDQLDALQQNPQRFKAINDETEEVEYMVLPSQGLEGVAPADLEGVLRGMVVEGDSVLPAGYSLASGSNIFAAPQLFTRDDLSFREAKDDPRRDYNLTGNVTFSPTETIDLRVGGTYLYNASRILGYYKGEGFARSIYNRDRFYNDEDRMGRGFITWRQRLSETTFFQVQAEYTDRNGWIYPNRFSRDLSDALFYGDVDYQANETLSNYWRVDPSTQELTRITDGNTDPGSVYGMFDLPGRGTGYYQKFDQSQFRLNGSVTTQIGLNQLEFGAEYEQRTQRYFDFEANTGRELAGYYNDVDGAELVEEGVDSYEELPFSALRDRVFTYGYGFRGLEEADDQDVGLYAQGVTNEANLNDSSFVYNVAPYQPIYYAGYIQDKIEYKDLVINVGVRVDVFDNNTLVLKDIYATTPIQRAGDLDIDVPAAINEDAAVYFNNNGDVVGYRRSNTAQFFDAEGNTADFETINQLGTPQAPENEAGEAITGLGPSLFEEYKPQVTFMPRVGVSFPVTDQSLFFASYNVTSQRPGEGAFSGQSLFAPFSVYRGLTGQDIINNSRLKPEKTTQYELGLRQRIGERAALQISGFYRTQEDKIRLRDLTEAFPSSYRTYLNEDFTTAKGLEFGFDLRRTNNLAVDANYTLQFAEATGSDANALYVISWLAPGSVPNFISPATFDRRHSLNASLDYRLDEEEGPEVFGARVFSNFGINLLGIVNSGFPYTQIAEIKPITDPQPGVISGELGDVRTPWTYRFDLKIDRRFMLGGGLSAKAYLWVQNLLNTHSALSVYRATGLPGNDGYFDTSQGQDAIRTVIPSGVSYRDHYLQYMSSPVDVSSYNMSKSGRIYMLPRRTRLGVLISF